MKVFILAVLITALTGVASAQASCVGRNTAACRDARNAFAEHHGGRYPSQWYQGQQGRWSRAGNDWRWRSNNGREYRRGNNGWNWREAQEEREEHGRGHHRHWDD